MVDEVVKNAEFTGMKKNDGEDPIIVAQRFLNIFKQLHIFNDERKKNFNDMLMELSPEIRGMFASLPGGSLLQEYVDDLESKSGNVRDRSGDTAALDTVSGDANILQNALKEVKEQEAGAAGVPKEGVKISADGNFAKEMAEALKEAGLGGGAATDLNVIKQALEINEDARKRETAELTKAITETQLKMAQMFLQNNTANNNANNIQIHTTGGNFPQAEELVGSIVKAQSEIFANMAKTQTEELSSIISLALRESQQLSTKTIVDAIAAFQKENLKILKGINSGEIDLQDTSEEKGGFFSSKKEKKNKDREKKKNKRNEKEELAEKEKSEWGFSSVLNKFYLDQSLFEFDGETNIPEEEEEIKIDDDYFAEDDDDRNIFFDDDNEDTEESIEEAVAEDIEDEKEEKIDSDDDDGIDSEEENPEDIEEVVIPEEDEEIAEENIEELKEPEQDNSDNISEENSEPVDDEIEEVIEEIEQEASVEEPVEAKEETAEVKEEPIKKKSLWDADDFEDNSIIDNLDEPLDLDKIQIADEEISGWGFETKEKNEEKKEDKKKKDKEDKKKKDKKETPKEEEIEEEWEWQEVEEDEADETNSSSEGASVAGDTSEDNEEYVIYDDVDGDISSIEMPVEVENEDFRVVDDNGIVNETYSEKNEEDDDWEWEYEEDTPESIETPKNPENQPNSENEEDWEWEYEEDTPESVENTPLEASTELTESDEDWEWEYEEDASESSENPENQPNSENEEDWEWEYEEDAPESAENTPLETPAEPTEEVEVENNSTKSENLEAPENAEKQTTDKNSDNTPENNGTGDKISA